MRKTSGNGGGLACALVLVCVVRQRVALSVSPIGRVPCQPLEIMGLPIPEWFDSTQTRKVMGGAACDLRPWKEGTAL